MFQLLASGYGCMPTASNWNCVVDPIPGDYGAYKDFSSKHEEPPHGDWVYWEHDQCKLDKANGTCR